MLRVYASTSAAQAKSYFSNELSKGDYYTEGQEIAGHWGGSAAQWMGLSGTVDQTAFNNLVDNTFPDSTPMAGEQITPHNKSNRRPGYDLTFNAPKALSVLYEYSKDERLLDAFRDAVHDTMGSIEEGMYTRVRKGGVNGERQTGNLAYAEFVHFTARPVDGLEPDPHLHAHCYTMNLTFDPVEEQWKAGEFGHIKTDAPYYEAMFHAHLSKSLSDMGLDIARDGKFWTLEELDKSTLQKFSHRTEQIEEKAEELGIKTDKGKDQLGASTRAGKEGKFSRDELREKWWQRLDDSEIATLEKLSRFKSNNDDSDNRKRTAEDTLDYAIHHTLERQSVIPVARLKEAALRQGFGDVSPDELEDAYRKREDLINVGAMATTKEILSMERQIISYTRNGYGMHRKLNEDYAIGPVTDHDNGTQFELSGEQKNVVSTLLDSRHSVQAVQGKAGTGKTTALATLIDGIEKGGGGATILAPTADAAYTTLKSDGEKYHCEAMRNASTLARFFVDEKLWQSSKGNTLIVDEAGLMSVDDMHTLFALANKFDNRVILVGDTQQHNSVMRGDAFRILQNEAGLKPVSLEKIRRQDGDYREAVKAVAEGKLVDGFNKLDAMGKVHVITDDEARYRTLAERFSDEYQSGKTVLSVAPTHAEGGKVTEAIREELKDRKLINANETTLTRLHNVRLTEAERGDAVNFESGQIVRFQQNAKGEFGRINRSDEFTVTKTDKFNVWMQDGGGQEQKLDLTRSDKFYLYEERDINVSKGDRLRITEGHKSAEGKRLNNGAIYHVKSIGKDGNITLENGWKLDSSKGNFDHGYVTTSITSQGKTVDHIFLAQGADYAGATSTEQFYVSVSRGKKFVELFTDDKDELRGQIQRSHVRTSATELVKQKAEERWDDMENMDGFLATVEQYARHFMEQVKDGAQHFLSQFARGHQSPHNDSSKWRDLVAEQREQKDRDLTL